jgi:hypothetical protein
MAKNMPANVGLIRDPFFERCTGQDVPGDFAVVVDRVLEELGLDVAPMFVGTRLRPDWR